MVPVLCGVDVFCLVDYERRVQTHSPTLCDCETEALMSYRPPPPPPPLHQET